MTIPLSCGSVVWVRISDPSGRNEKDRPAIVISSPNDLQQGTVFIVAVTSRMELPLPDNHVLLPWNPSGSVSTKLIRKSAAVCDWIQRIDVNKILKVVGVVQPNVLSQILIRVARHLPP